MSTHDVAASLARAAREREALPQLIEALEAMVYDPFDDKSLSMAISALDSIGRRLDPVRYRQQQNLLRK